VAMMEEKIEEFKFEFDRLMAVMPISDVFWRDSAMPTVEIVKLAHESFVQAIIKWEVARRRLAEYRWPATWRDAFKERWFPAWAKRRWPVRYRKVSIDELAAAKRGDDEFVRYFIECG